MCKARRKSSQLRHHVDPVLQTRRWRSQWSAWRSAGSICITTSSTLPSLSSKICLSSLAILKTELQRFMAVLPSKTSKLTNNVKVATTKGPMMIPCRASLSKPPAVPLMPGVRIREYRILKIPLFSAFSLLCICISPSWDQDADTRARWLPLPSEKSPH